MRREFTTPADHSHVNPGLQEALGQDPELCLHAAAGADFVCYHGHLDRRHV